MGRERQKFKNRSSISKVKQRTKSKKLVLANPIIAANWDNSQTLSQNYKRLGLATKLNKQTGGVEKDVALVRAAKEAGDLPTITQDSLQIQNSAGVESFALGEAKVTRDPKTGRILQVVDDGSKLQRANPLGDSLNDLDSDSDEEEEKRVALANQHGNTDVATVTKKSAVPAQTNVVRQLEERAALPAARYKRKQTENERAFVQALVTKHGHDYAKMARDMKLNYMQRSEGDLKKRIKIWEENGGTVD